MLDSKKQRFLSDRQKFVAEIVEELEFHNNLDLDAYKNKILKEIKKGKLF